MRCAAKAPVTKVLYPAAIHFKGSGFYSTDYGRKGQRAGTKDGDGGDSSGKKPEKPESKPSESKAADQ